MERLERLALPLDRRRIGGSRPPRTDRGRSARRGATRRRRRRPSTSYVPTENGFFVLKTRGRYASGRMPVRRAWTSRLASQCGRNRTGAGVLRIRHGAPARSTSARPSSSRYSDAASAPSPPAWRRLTGIAGPRRDVPPRRRPECPQVRRGRGGRGLPPRSRRAGRPRPRPAPSRSARRRSHVPDGGTRTRSTHRPEVADEPVAELAELLDRAGAVGEGLAQRVRARRSSRPRRAASGREAAAPTPRRAWRTPIAYARTRRRETMWIVVRMSVAWITSVLEGVRQRRRAEARQPAPQPDVAGRGVLGLEAADLLDRLRDRQVARSRRSWRSSSVRRRARRLSVGTDRGAGIVASIEHAAAPDERAGPRDRRRILGGMTSATRARQRATGRVDRDPRRLGVARHRPADPAGQPAPGHGVGAPPKPLLARARHRGDERRPRVRDERGGGPSPRRAHGPHLARVPGQRRLPRPACARDPGRPPADANAGFVIATPIGLVIASVFSVLATGPSAGRGRRWSCGCGRCCLVACWPSWSCGRSSRSAACRRWTDPRHRARAWVC